MAAYRLHKLETMSMAAFERLYFGDATALIAEGECSDEKALSAAASKMLEEYITIVSAGSASAELARRNNLIKLEMRVAVLEAAKTLAEARMYDDACKVMRSLGYELEATKKNGIKMRIDGVLAADRYRLEQMKKSDAGREEIEPDRDHFVKERVQVMRWAKMRINPKDITAKEYAYMVRAMIDEAHAQEKEIEKIKSKKK